MSDQPRSPGKPPSRRPQWVLPAFVGGVGVLGALAVVVVFVFFPRRVENGGVGSGLPSAEECRRLEELKNVALGFLENEKFDLAEKRFVEIVAKLPGEPLGHRNLAICRLLWHGCETCATKADPAQTQAAIDSLLKREPKNWLGHLLAARFELRPEVGLDWEAMNARQRRALEAYQRAIALAPENPALRFELYEKINTLDDSETKGQRRAALREAHQLVPDNLWVLKEWLLEQAQSKDASIVETLTAAEDLIRPIGFSVKRRANVDVMELLAQAKSEAAKGDWERVRILPVSNIIMPDDILQSDHRRVVRHLLELADYEFSAEFRKRVDSVRPAAPPAIPIEFHRLPSDDALSGLSGVVALELADFDLNGTPDLIVLREREILVLGRSEPTEPWQTICRADIPEGFSGILAADLDLDENRDAVERKLADELKAPKGLNLKPETCPIADVDLVLYGEAGVLLLRNQRDADSGARSLEPVALEEKLQEVKQVSCAVFVDFYHDGDLDLVLSSEDGVSLWTNRGNMLFGDLSEFSQLPPKNLRFTSMIAVDWDRDVDLDVVVSGAGDKALGYLENLRHGQFRWRPFDNSFAELDKSPSLALLEVDGNASWELAGAGERGLGLVQTATPSGVVRETKSSRLSKEAWGNVLAWDYDNDGLQDLLAWNADRLTVWHGQPGAEFQDTAKTIADPPKGIRACTTGDLDADGDLDLLVAQADGIAVFSNEGGNRNHWLELRLRGDLDPQMKSGGRINHNAIGALVELKIGRKYQAQVSTRATVHFGLGDASRADVVRLLWPNGIPQSVVEPKPDQIVFEKQVLKGSCPYLYTWTGERYEFFTDLLWAAPLGLQFAEGKLAPSRPWEYLKIPGDRLALKDGRYSLQITEELWEAGYFDQVELIAVDHPADVEIYSNEKVGPAEIAQFKVHAVRQPRTPVAARDKHGRDVLEEIRRRDGVFFRGFDGRILQGLTDEHYLELDLGPLKDPQRITLFLTGWIYPTDTSLNVGIGENPALLPPRPPFVLVPNEQGQWQEAVPYMGFPGGKTKTIAVDLSHVFAARDYRLRIVTSHQIYWDEAFFTVDEKPAAVKLSALKLVSADLHYRGFCEAFPKRLNTPDTYDYAKVLTEPQWPPMRGKFTRYGDVRELLTETDDLHVVMGSGDEMTLEFEPISDPPPGWKRDFLIHNVGWDKDADLNTVYGQTVEPLPYAAMKSYPLPPDEPYPDTPRHRRYLETYQTRQQQPARFWKQLCPAAR